MKFNVNLFDKSGVKFYTAIVGVEAKSKEEAKFMSISLVLALHEKETDIIYSNINAVSTELSPEQYRMLPYKEFMTGDEWDASSYWGKDLIEACIKSIKEK